MRLSFGVIKIWNPFSFFAVSTITLSAKLSEAKNPMPLVIPCHRVIGTDGKLHGYGGRGGLETKSWLLQLENQGIV